MESNFLYFKILEETGNLNTSSRSLTNIPAFDDVDTSAIFGSKKISRLNKIKHTSSSFSLSLFASVII